MVEKSGDVIMTEKEMQLIIGKKIGIENICIPNVLLVGEYRKEDLPEIEKMNIKPCKMYEADLIYITKSRYLTEIEIKTTIEDFRNDFKKKIYHSCPLVSSLYYAFPWELYHDYEKEILEKTRGTAGIIIILNKYESDFFIKAPKRKNVMPLSRDEIAKFMRVGCMKWFKEW